MEDNLYLRLYEYIDIPLESESEGIAFSYLLDTELQVAIYEKLLGRLEENSYTLDECALYWSLFDTFFLKRAYLAGFLIVVFISCQIQSIFLKLFITAMKRRLLG